MADIAAAGFKSVINNRPDFEGGPDQPTNASLEAAARAAGLEYAFLPVQSAFQTPEEIARFGELLDDAAAPDPRVLPLGHALGRLYRAAQPQRLSPRGCAGIHRAGPSRHTFAAQRSRCRSRGVTPNEPEGNRDRIAQTVAAGSTRSTSSSAAGWPGWCSPRC